MSSTLPPQTIADFLKDLESAFLPYQTKYIYDNCRFIAVEKAVRIGLTYAHSYKASKKRVFRHPARKPIQEIFCSKNLTVARDYLAYHRKWAEAWNALLPGTVDTSRWTTEKAVYPGGDILVMSSDPDSFRGMEADITLDEFAFHDSQEALFAAAQSRIQWIPDGQVSLISSHSHPETTFARLVSEIKAGKRPAFSLHRTTIEDAVAQGLALKVPGPHQKLLVKRAA